MKLKIPTSNYGKKVRQNFLQPLQTAQPLLANNQREQFVLKISMYSALLLAILGIGFGLSFKSAAIVFDGIIALISVLFIVKTMMCFNMAMCALNQW